MSSRSLLAARAPALASLAVMLVWVLAPTGVRAQLPDLIDVSAQYMPGVDLEDPRPARAQVGTYDASVNVPLQLAAETFLIPGLNYHAEAVSYSRAPAELDQLRLLQSIDLAVLLVQLLPRDWSLSVRMSGGLAGDLEAVDGRAFRVNTLVMATHAFSDRFVLGGGALTNYAFGSLLPLPVVYLDYRPVAALQLEASIPAFVNLKYTFGDRVEVGLRAEVSGNAYAIRDPRVRNDWPCSALARDDPDTAEREDAADPARCTDHVAYSVVTAGVQVGVRLFETLWLTALGGRSLYRRVEPMNATDDPIDRERQTLPNALTLRVGLTWRLPQQ